MDCSPPGSSIHGIFQARILEWVAISYATESSQPRDRTWVSCIAGRFFIIWDTREAHLNLKGTQKGDKYLPFSSYQTAATPYGEPQGSSGCERHKKLLPELRCTWKEWFKWAQTLVSSIYRKVLNSLTWDSWFSLISNNFWIFRLTYLLLQNLCITWFLPSPPWKQLSQGHMRCYLLGMIPKHFYWIKHNS